MRKILIGLLFIFVFPIRVFAEGEFKVGLDVTYKYNREGVPTVEQKITLTNKTAYQYASKYEMEISGDNPTNIKAWDSAGPLKVDISDKITAYFNNFVAGIDKSYQFHLSYLGKPALHNGQVWEVNFPKSNDDYRLSVIIPKNFGRLAFSSPSPESNNGEVIVFNNAKSGVVAAFGDFQTYKFDLSYTLQGPGTIALPADTGYQRVFYDSLTPAPANVKIDEDGNWLAYYNQELNQNLVIKAQGTANVLSEPALLVPATDLAVYLQPTRYWPSDNQEFIRLAQRYKTPKEIYDFVVSSLSYGFNNVRKGGLLALENPNNSLCQEFTDLFITMNRAANIPAREINGFAYTTDNRLRPLFLAGTDILHAWPQYWDEKRQTWISVDPTWEKTTGGIDYFSKLDFNHFTFVTHGAKDDTPLSAGFYKLPNDTSRNINVDIGVYRDYSTKPLETRLDIPRQIWAPLGAKAILHIDNPNGFAVYNTTYDVLSQNGNIETLPPFSKITVMINIKPVWKLNFSDQTIVVTVSGISKTYNIYPVNYLVWHGSIAVFSAFVLLTVGVVASRAWSVHLQRQT
ncbi:MAG: transglutaminase family protein [Patescibacteria group bacterium]